MPGLCDAGADDLVAVQQRDTLDACRVATHDAHIRLVKADGKAVLGCKQDVVFAVRLHDGNQLVALVERERADARFSGGIETRKKDPLDRALLRDEHEVVVIKFVDRDARGDGLARL